VFKANEKKKYIKSIKLINKNYLPFHVADADVSPLRRTKHKIDVLNNKNTRKLIFFLFYLVVVSSQA
jgi:hypothetical protein